MLSIANSSFVATSLNTLHHTLSDTINLLKNLHFLFATASDGVWQLNTSLHISTTSWERVEKIFLKAQLRAKINGIKCHIISLFAVYAFTSYTSCSILLTSIHKTRQLKSQPCLLPLCGTARPGIANCCRGYTGTCKVEIKSTCRRRNCVSAGTSDRLLTNGRKRQFYNVRRRGVEADSIGGACRPSGRMLNDARWSLWLTRCDVRYPYVLEMSSFYDVTTADCDCLTAAEYVVMHKVLHCSTCLST